MVIKPNGAGVEPSRSNSCCLQDISDIRPSRLERPDSQSAQRGGHQVGRAKLNACADSAGPRKRFCAIDPNEGLERAQRTKIPLDLTG